MLQPASNVDFSHSPELPELGDTLLLKCESDATRPPVRNAWIVTQLGVKTEYRPDEKKVVQLEDGKWKTTLTKSVLVTDANEVVAECSTSSEISTVSQVHVIKIGETKTKDNHKFLTVCS